MFSPWFARKQPTSSDGSEQGSSGTGRRRPCIVCKMRFANNCLPVHLAVNQVYRCRLCNASMHPSQMHRHISEIHIKVHRCQTCGEGFASPAELNRHSESKHGGVASKPAPPPQGPSPAHSYACEFCGKVFQQGVVFRLHRRMHTGPEPYFCGRCKKRFATCKGLESHAETCGDGATKEGAKSAIQPRTSPPSSQQAPHASTVGGDGESGAKNAEDATASGELCPAFQKQEGTAVHPASAEPRQRESPLPHP